MLKVERALSVPKETDDFTDGLAVFVVTTIKEIKDNGGFSVGDDLPGVAVAAMALVPHLTAAMSMGVEMKEDVAGFLACWALAGAKIAGALLEK